jgi:Na+:H+ antiporter, NhaA family
MIAPSSSFKITGISIALAWVNSPWTTSYFAPWHTSLAVAAGSVFARDLHFWINDGLMALFFFVVGLEIKRKFVAGEPASPQQAALPVAAAMGGVAIPALVYSALNFWRSWRSGWGIPMATDIAFVIGVMALLERRVATGLKVFVTALAIVDDLAAVVVIALFYTAHISWTALSVATLTFF